ncbi:hypothetical protein D3C76_1067530 [compost metagenome]
MHETHDQPQNLVLILQHQKIEGALVSALHSLDQLLILFLGQHESSSGILEL